MVSVPLTTTFVYLLAVFSFGFSGDLAARHSMYPVRMFTLPVTNAALVGWPDRKSTRLNSSHSQISYAVFCLKKKKNKRVIDFHDNRSRTLPHDGLRTASCYD